MTTASGQVAAICGRIGPFIHPHADVDEEAWAQWLGAFQGIPEPLGSCPECGLPLRRVSGRYGEFIGCEGYKKGGRGCNYTRPT